MSQEDITLQRQQDQSLQPHRPLPHLDPLLCPSRSTSRRCRVRCKAQPPLTALVIHFTLSMDNIHRQRCASTSARCAPSYRREKENIFASKADLQLHTQIHMRE